MTQIEAKESLVKEQAGRLAELERLRAEAQALRKSLAAARAEALGHEQRAAVLPSLTAELSALKMQVGPQIDFMPYGSGMTALRPSGMWVHALPVLGHLLP